MNFSNGTGGLSLPGWATRRQKHFYIKHKILGDGIAVLAVVPALLLALPLTKVTGQVGALTLLVTAVIVSALYGGVRPGLVTSATSCLVSDYFFVSPVYSLNFALDDILRLGIFGIVALLASSLAARRHQEPSRSASEELFSKAFLSNPDPISISTLAGGRFLEVNEAFLRMTGYSREELMGRTATELGIYNHAEDRLKLRQPPGKGTTDNLEIRFLMKNGELRIGLLSRWIAEIEGERCVIAVTSDITERKRAEDEVKARGREQAALAELSQRALSGEDLSTLMSLAVTFVAQALEVEYCKVVEMLPGGTVLVSRASVGWRGGIAGRDPQAGYTLLSNAPVLVEDLRTDTRFPGTALFQEHGVVSGISVIVQGQYQPFGVLCAHTTMRRTFTKDDTRLLEAVAHFLAEAINGKLDEEARRRAYDDLESSATQKTNELVIANAFLKEQIAKRKRGETERLSSEARFAGILNIADDAIISVGEDQRVTLFSQGAEAVFGYSAQEALGQPFDVLLPLRFTDGPSRDIAELANDTTESRRTGECCEILCRRKDGTDFPAEVFISPVESGGTRLYNVIFRDITQRKRAAEEIVEGSRQLAILNEATAAVSTSLELSEVLAILRILLADHLNISAGGIFLYEKADRRLYLRKAWGLTRETLTEFTNSHSIKAEWQKHICFPLLAKGELEGVAVLVSDPQSALKDRSTLFKTLGQHVGVAIQNARLFEQVRKGHERLQTLSEKLVEIQETERRHIALELHDEIGQSLTALRLSLELCSGLPADEASKSLGNAQALASELIAQVRTLSLDLRPSMLDDLGLLPALVWHFQRYTALTKIRVAFEHTRLQGRFQPKIETGAYRIVQEALTNIARHAGVKEATVRAWASGEMLCVEVEDRGVGFNPESALNAHCSSGLTGMRERAVLLGGHLRIGSAVGAGACLRAEFPLGTAVESTRMNNERDHNSVGR